MNNLIAMLKKIESLNIPNSDNIIINNNTDISFISEAEATASEVLIDENGKNIWSNHEILENAGYRVFMGERDGFGWLSGCIQTQKGILIYD